MGAAKQAIRPTKVGGNGQNGASDIHPGDISDDDAVVDEPGLSSHELLARELGAEVIEDIRDDVSG